MLSYSNFTLSPVITERYMRQQEISWKVDKENLHLFISTSLKVVERAYQNQNTAQIFLSLAFSMFLCDMYEEHALKQFEIVHGQGCTEKKLFCGVHCGKSEGLSAFFWQFCTIYENAKFQKIVCCPISRMRITAIFQIVYCFIIQFYGIYLYTS